MLGQLLDVYRVKEVIGHGGMGRVYRAVDMRSGLSVALKIVDCPDLHILQRFQREAQLLSKLSHPNIVRILSDLRKHRQSIYFVMEYVPGLNLGEVLKRMGVLDVALSLSITSEILKALITAHRQGIVHRDLKPNNILLAAPFRVKLSDFGLSLDTDTTRFTRSGHFLGTPAYISPEQGEGLAVDHRADIYSLGIMLYEMVTGRIPFTGHVLAVLRQHREDPPTPPSLLRPDLPPGVEELILTAIAKTPSERFQSAAAMLAQVEGLRKLVGLSNQQRQLQSLLKPRIQTHRILRLHWYHLLLLLALFLAGDTQAPAFLYHPIIGRPLRQVRLTLQNGRQVQGHLWRIAHYPRQFILLTNDGQQLRIPFRQVRLVDYLDGPPAAPQGLSGG